MPPRPCCDKSRVKYKPGLAFLSLLLNGSCIPVEVAEKAVLFKKSYNAESCENDILTYLRSRVAEGNSAILRFGIFELDTRTGELRKRGIKLRISDQAYRILHELLMHPGEVVSRERLKETIWPDRPFVDSDSAINKSISQLRTLLADSGENPRFIETLSKRGYRFIAPIADPVRTKDSAVSSIVVLPFDNLTGEPAQAYLAEGVAEVLTSGLGGLSGVRVISRTSAKACDAGSKSLAGIGRELNVDAVVEGSVLRVDTKLHVAVRLVDIQSECVRWQGRYDSELGDLFALCDRVTEAIAQAINASRGSPRTTVHRASSAPPDTHLAYLKARYLWHKRTEKDLYASIAEFQRALASDSGFALAHAGLADAYALLGIWGFEPSHSAFGMARRAAERALELDDTLAEAHACLAEVLKDYDWDWPAAEREYQRAIAINPTYSIAHHWYSQLLVSLTRYTEAAEQIETARRLDPLSPAINAYVPYIYLAARDYTRAMQEGERAVELEPHSPLAHWQFGRACLFAGEMRRAIEELDTASRLAHRRPMWEAELCFVRARVGDKSGAVAILDEIATLARSSYVSPYDFAVCHAGLGNSGEALNFLEQAFRERVMRIMAIGDAEFDSLHYEPRFEALVERLRLPSRRNKSVGGLIGTHQ